MIVLTELRDPATAFKAFDAAHDGTLVIAGINTNSASAAISELLAMGIEAWPLGATLKAVVERASAPAPREQTGRSDRTAMQFGAQRHCFPANIMPLTCHRWFTHSARALWLRTGRSGRTTRPHNQPIRPSHKHLQHTGRRRSNMTQSSPAQPPVQKWEPAAQPANRKYPLRVLL